MELQKNERYTPTLQTIGCLFMVLGRIVELETGYTFEPEEVNEVWKHCVYSKYVIMEIIREPDKILREYALLTRNPYLKVYQVGEFRNGKEIFWNWAIPRFTNYKYAIEEVKTFGTEGRHFRLCNRDREVIFDSYENYRFEQLPRYIYYTVV